VLGGKREGVVASRKGRREGRSGVAKGVAIGGRTGGGEGRVYKEPLKLYGGTLPEPEVSFFTVQAPTLYVAEMYGA
jgi:hypothetical protein